jgi:hypothetical protein
VAHITIVYEKEPFNQNCINCSMQERFFSWKGQIGIPWCVHTYSKFLLMWPFIELNNYALSYYMCKTWTPIIVRMHGSFANHSNNISSMIILVFTQDVQVVLFNFQWSRLTNWLVFCYMTIHHCCCNASFFFTFVHLRFSHELLSGLNASYTNVKVIVFQEDPMNIRWMIFHIHFFSGFILSLCFKWVIYVFM